MATVNAFYSSSTASSSLMHAFMAQSQASMLQNLSFFNSDSGRSNDTVDFSQTARDGSMFMSIIQGGNTSLFGSVFKDAAAFNQSLMTSVSTAAGFHFDSDNSLLGQLVDHVA